MRTVFAVTLLALGIAASAEVGPRLTDAEFFGMLDSSKPELAGTVRAAKSGDYSAARHEFAEYLRGRLKPIFDSINPHARPRHDSRPAGADTTDADRILQHDMPVAGRWHKYQGSIDWTGDAIGYREWPFLLNRHWFWGTLGNAYWATGDEKYAREFVSEMTDWVARNPVPVGTSGNETSAWRTLEQGFRCANTWPVAFNLFLTSPSFTDDAMVTMVKSFVEHARQLTKYNTVGNWLTMEADGLMHVGVLFPEFSESSEWRKTAADRLYAELDRQVYPDGSQIELSTTYHQVSLLNFEKAWDIARINDIPMPDGYVPKLEKMYDYDLGVCMPDGAVPGLNDGDHQSIRDYLRRGFELFPKRTDFQWLATAGKQGTRPTIGSTAFPFAGQFVMRSGWEPNDLYLMMDAGPFGYGHQHEDALSLVLYAHGKYHVIDPDNYAYDESKWRKYIVSTRAHNTVMVDGLEQHRGGKPREQYVLSRPLPNKWATSERFDFASGAYTEGYGPGNEVKVTHARSVFFVKPEYWIVTDLLTPADDKPHHYQSMFHLDADAAQANPNTKSVRTVNSISPNLSIIPLADQGLSAKIVSGQEEPVVQGWAPTGGAVALKVKPIPTPTFEITASGPTWMAYVLYPTATGAACPVRCVDRVEMSAEPEVKAIGLAVRFDNGRTDYFVQADRRSDLAFGDYRANGIGAYVQTDNGEATRAVVLDGTQLSRSWKPVEAQSLPLRDMSQ